MTHPGPAQEFTQYRPKPIEEPIKAPIIVFIFAPFSNFYQIKYRMNNLRQVALILCAPLRGTLLFTPPAKFRYSKFRKY